MKCSRAIGALVALTTFVGVGGHASSAWASERKAPIPLYSPQKLLRLIRQHEVTFVDVREPAEFAVDHIPGAVNIPRRDLATAKDRLDLHTVLIPYCNMDFRGFVAARALEELGFQRVALMQERGLEGWKRSGLPVAGARSGWTDEQALAQLKIIDAKGLPGTKTVSVVKPTGRTHTFDLSVGKWYFEPNDFLVNAGDEVRFRVTSQAGDHWFIMPDFELQVELPEGTTREVAFLADRRGDYQFGSCEWDGAALQVMKGRLHVE